MLKLKRFSEGAWFDYPAGGRFKIRPLLPKDLIELREKTRSKIAIRGISGSQEIVDDYDEGKLNLSIFYHMIEDWKDIEIEGTSSEIKDAIFNNMQLRDWITLKSGELAIQYNESFEDESKN